TEWRRLLASSSSWDGLNDTLKKRGITHVLYTDSLYQWAALMGRKNYPVVSGIERPPGSPDYYTQLENWVTFDAYSANYLQMVYSDKMGYLVYKLK
ncbi:MAG TPA: hypothetical protein VEZ90_18565, partial [Blastocatellia bacterium]|nr:hypothetical protein [Blastocatellia bacterium]